MAIYIKIKKVLEKDGIGYYKAFTKEFDGADFYLGIDKKARKISYYFNDDFSNSIRIIDCNNPDERIGQIPGVSPSILGKVFMKAFKVFKLDEFPEYISHEAWLKIDKRIILFFDEYGFD